MNQNSLGVKQSQHGPVSFVRVQNHPPVQVLLQVQGVDSSIVRANHALPEQGYMKKCQENEARAGRQSELFASFKVKQRSACEDELQLKP